MRLIRRMRSLMRELLALRAARGPYRFLVRRWDGVSDIDLAVRVLGSEFFKKELVPVPLPVKSLCSILVIAPHQDDAAIGAGGTLLIASDANVDIDVLYVTDGAAEDPAYASTSADSVIVRNREAEKACEKLGATMRQLGISNLAPRPTVEDLEYMGEVIKELRPQILMMPWVLDSPAKHRLINHLLFLTHRRVKLPDCEVWGYQVHNTLFPNGYVDITNVAEQKQQVLACFQSQNQHYQCYGHLAMGMAAWNARLLPPSPSPRYVEVFFALPLHELLRLVESFYFDDLHTTYRGHSHVIKGASRIHRTVMEQKRSGLVGR